MPSYLCESIGWIFKVGFMRRLTPSQHPILVVFPPWLSDHEVEANALKSNKNTAWFPQIPLQCYLGVVSEPKLCIYTLTRSRFASGIAMCYEDSCVYVAIVVRGEVVALKYETEDKAMAAERVSAYNQDRVPRPTEFPFERILALFVEAAASVSMVWIASYSCLMQLQGVLELCLMHVTYHGINVTQEQREALKSLIARHGESNPVVELSRGLMNEARAFAADTSNHECFFFDGEVKPHRRISAGDVVWKGPLSVLYGPSGRRARYVELNKRKAVLTLWEADRTLPKVKVPLANYVITNQRLHRRSPNIPTLDIADENGQFPLHHPLMSAIVSVIARLEEREISNPFKCSDYPYRDNPFQ